MNRKQRRAQSKPPPQPAKPDPRAAIPTLLAEAVRRQEAGEFEAATKLHGQILSLDPNQPDSHYLLGMIASHDGRHEQAVGLIAKAIALNPGAAAYHSNLGVALRNLGRREEAAAACRRAIELRPDYAEAYNNLGVILQDAGRIDEAVAGYRAAIALRPDFAEAWFNLGNTLRQRQSWEEAADCFRRAAELQPDRAGAHANLGDMLIKLRRIEDAVVHYRRAVALQPDFLAVLNNLGAAMKELRRTEEAVEYFRKALLLKPDHAETWSNLGITFSFQGRLEEAVVSCRRAVELRPDYPDAHLNLAVALQNLGLLREAQQEYERALACDPDCQPAMIGMSSCASYRHDVTLAEAETQHRRYGRFHRRDFAPLEPRPRQPGEKLRIGYISSDFRIHPVAQNLLPVIRAHDRSAFSLHFYAQNAASDSYGLEFRALADGWRDIQAFDDPQVAELIRKDGIDILVSLAGRFDDNRPQVCAWRAAPVQISMHDVATSGLAEMDYIVADRWLIPGGSREYFTERPLRLPNFYIADMPGDLPAITPRGDGPPVFASFNNPAKITPPVLDAWGRILAAMPEAKLLLKYRNSFGAPSLRARYLATLARFGARPEQVEFITLGEPQNTHLERYNDIDVALDSLPFSGSTTSFEALTMGVPVVTWPWARMAGRWTAGMLQTMGLTETIAGSAEDYIRIAVGLARDRAAWRERRGEIRQRLANSALCDGPRWARRIERLYRAVWRRYQAVDS